VKSGDACSIALSSSSVAMASRNVSLAFIFPVDARNSDDGGTALHAAAYSGCAPAIRLLLDRGADVEACDTAWNSTPIVWAAIGSGERPAGNPSPDWAAAVQALLDAGSSARDVTFSPDDPKPPSPEVAALLRQHVEPSRRDDGRY
jgi:hypothetical protein